MRFPDDGASVLEWALFYVRSGFAVIAIHGIVNGACTCGRIDCRMGKHPIAKGWATHPATTEDAARTMFERAPSGANIGLVMGQQPGDDGPYLVAFDIDGERGRERIRELEAKLGPFPATLTSRTGRADGGEHRIVMLAPGQDAKRVTNKAQHGLDIRAKGGQIVVAPSLHFSGGRYAWSSKRAIAELPDAWFEAIATPPKGSGGGGGPKGPGPGGGDSGGGAVYAFGDHYLDAMLGNTCKRIAETREGGRNQLLFSSTCTVLEYANGHNVPHGKALELLAEAGRACGLPAAEVDDTIRKAQRHVDASGETRRAPPPDKAKAARRHAEKRRGSSGSKGSSEPASGVVEGSGSSGSSGSEDDVEEDEPESWRAKLIRRADGALDKTIANVDVVLRHHPFIAGKIRYDLLAERVTVVAPPWAPEDVEPRRWTDVDDTRLQVWLRTCARMNAAHGDVARAAEAVAHDAAYDPIVEKLRGLPAWDEVPRASTWLVDVMGAEPSDYVHAVGRQWLVSAVARAMRPGCQVDTMLILEGGQGRGKSSVLRALAMDDAWFLESPIDLRDPGAPKLFRGRWIVEFPELASLKGNDVERVKAVITTRIDSYRRAYARHEIDVPRRCVLVGSTNDEVYLRDHTGARRFLPVAIGNVPKEVMLERMMAVRDQLWAEALVAYDAGERWWMDDERLVEAAESEQEGRYAADPWEPVVAAYLSNPVRQREGVTTAEVLGGSLGIEVARRSRVDELRVAAVLRHLGCKRLRRRGATGKPEWRFIPQKPAAVRSVERIESGGSGSPLSAEDYSGSPIDPHDPNINNRYIEGGGATGTHGGVGDAHAPRATEVLSYPLFTGTSGSDGASAHDDSEKSGSSSEGRSQGIKRGGDK